VLARGDARGAERFFERAPAGFREYGLARVHHAYGRVSQANELYKEALGLYGSDIEWLCDAFDAAQKTGDTEQADAIIGVVTQLKPTVPRKYKVNPRLIFDGLAMDAPWLSRDGYLNVTLFWRVGDSRSPQQLVVVERDARNLVARAGERIFHKTTVRNLLVEPGFETGAQGQRYPLGFAKDEYYPSNPDQCQIVIDDQPDHSGDQCLRMAGIGERLTTSALSRDLTISGGAYYMVSGNLRTRGGDAQMACLWSDALGQIVPTEVAPARAHERMQWTPTALVLRAPYSATACSVRISNWKSEGQSFFDDVFFIEVPVQRSILSLL
jgi:hypothetical protein